MKEYNIDDCSDIKNTFSYSFEEQDNLDELDEDEIELYDYS